MLDKPLVAGLLCVIFGVFGAVRGWTRHVDESAIARDGARAEGHVTHKWVHEPSDAGKDYIIGYTFDLPSGELIEGKHEIDPIRFHDLRQGDPITVLYAREDPRRSFPDGAGSTSSRSAVFGMMLSAFIVLIGVALIVRHWLHEGRRGG